MMEDGRQRGVPRLSPRLLVPSPVAVVRHPDKTVYGRKGLFGLTAQRFMVAN